MYIIYIYTHTQYSQRVGGSHNSADVVQNIFTVGAVWVLDAQLHSQSQPSTIIVLQRELHKLYLHMILY